MSRTDPRPDASASGSMPLPWRTRLRLALAGVRDPDSRWRSGFAGWLAVEAERRRFFLWLPVAYGAGIAFYFAAEHEPAAWPGPLFAAATAAVAAALGGFWHARIVALVACLFFLGFSVATVRTYQVAQPVLARAMIAPVSGFVRSVEERPQGPRAVIDVESIGALPAGERPGRVRLTFRRGTIITPGSRISATARLVPPPQPARPGGYDFARDAFFNGIGAVGTVTGRVEASDAAARATPGTQLAAWIDGLRNALTRRIIAAGGGQPVGGAEGGRWQEAAFVAALVTGKRGMLTDETNDALRAAGIYHVVSIGGFHMTLVAGTIFFITRALLASWPALALRGPVRKTAAVAGIVGAGIYCVFSGAGIDTLRAFVVTLIVMGAILLNRPALSMRNLALAAFVCLTMQPETLLGPSFQMSFAGVAALIALFERWNDGTPASGALPVHEGGGLPLKDAGTGRGLLWRIAVIGTATTIVAMLATGPFSAFHFQTFNPWGIIGNAFGLPLVELLVMPLAFLGVMLHPFGLDGPLWYLAGLAATPVLTGSRLIEGFAGATVVIPAFGPGVLALLAGALLWACLWTTPLRLLAILPAGLGVALAAMPDRPDILVDREGRGAMIRGADGHYVVLGRPSSFTVEQWLRSDGDPRGADDASLRNGVACDKLGCVTRLPDGRDVAFALDERAAYEDCTRAAIIITRWPAPPDCAAGHVIDRGMLERHGALSLTFSGGDLVASGAGHDSSDPATDERPWR